MSEIRGSDDFALTSSAVDDSVVQELRSAESFTILIHGVGAEASEDLLHDAKYGYLASGFGDAVDSRELPGCPALSLGKGAEAILIKGQKGGHFVIALPWNNRVRLASVAQNCLIALSLLMTMTAAGYVIDANLSGDRHGAWIRSLLKPAVQILYKAGHGWKGGIFLGFLFSFAQYAINWWAPWLWVLACLLVLVLSIRASKLIIPCIPIARTIGWGFVLTMLAIALAFISLASVHTMWSASRAIPTHNLNEDTRLTLCDVPLYCEIEATRADQKISSAKVKSVLPQKLPLDTPQVRRAASENKSGPKIDSATNFSGIKPSLDRQSAQASSNKDVSERNPSEPSDGKPKYSAFVTCLFFILICGSGIVFANLFGLVLDFGLDVLHYGSDEKYDRRIFDRLSDAVRWLHSQAPNAHITIVAHSLGSVIASQAMSSISESEQLMSQVTLITLGSPLNYLYRIFPNMGGTPRKLSAAICSRARWINLWRRSDMIERELDVEPGVLVQYCIGEGGHRDYWRDGAVWKAVVYESLRIGDFTGKVSSPGDPARAYLEVYLGWIAALAIVILLLLGIGVWHMLPLLTKAVHLVRR
jgi:hypothetical protein